VQKAEPLQFLLSDSLDLEHPEKTHRVGAVYSVAMALACLIAYGATTELSKVAAQWHADAIAGLWAAVSTAFVVRDTRQRSLTAGVGRLIATCVSFALCLPYLWLFAPSLAGDTSGPGYASDDAAGSSR
jgi:hypothetical protein